MGLYLNEDGVLTPIAGRGDLTEVVANLSHDNLLDNPWFTVNQRRATSWSSGYGVDRWILQRADVTVNADKTLTITPTELSTNNGYIGQRIEKENSLLGKMVTISALLSDGTITSHTFDTIEDTVNSAVEDNYNFGYSTTTSNSYDLVWFGLRSNSTISSVTVKAVKLELGSVSTLAMDTAPNYQQELAKCQRYYINVKDHIYILDDNGNADVPFYNEFRTTPTCTLKRADIYENGSWVSVASSVTINASNDQFIRQNIYIADQSKAYKNIRIAFEASADL